MNEQQMEILERMLPRGFVITMIAKNDSAISFMSNPEGTILLDRLFDTAKQETEDQKSEEV